LRPFLSHSNLNGGDPEEAEQKTEAFPLSCALFGKKNGFIFGFSVDHIQNYN
jgi:hypothetical protein